MGEIIVLEESEFAGFIDDGARFAATVSGVRKRTKPFKDEFGQPIVKYEFAFKLISDDGHDGRDIWGETSTRWNTHPENRLNNWVQAILGQRLPPRFELDLDTLQDRHCFVVVGRKDYTNKDGEQKIRNFVRDVQPTTANAKALAQDEPF